MPKQHKTELYLSLKDKIEALKELSNILISTELHGNKREEASKLILDLTIEFIEKLKESEYA